MADRNAADRVRAIFSKDSEQEYVPVYTDSEGDPNDPLVRRPLLIIDDTLEDVSDDEDEEGEGGDSPKVEFSWLEYFVFMLLGVAMLWAWNMFLAAAPYFQARFADNEKILASFQPSITSVSCVTNLSSMSILASIQKKASYPNRILAALGINIVVFGLLAVSTTHFRGISSAGYLVFTLFMVFFASLATGLCQNGAFAFAASFGRPEYINAILTGNAVAGVLPALAQIISVLSVPLPDAWATAAELDAIMTKENTTSAFAYFLTATFVSAVTGFAFVLLVRKHNRILEATMMTSMTSIEEAEQSKRKVISMWVLWKKTHWLAASLFLCFTVTMFFPVFTQKVVSTIPEDQAPRLFRSAAFIPLSFLVWNVGDLCGRLVTLTPLRMKQHPIVLFVISTLRVGFIPMYLLCNIQGHGAIINSDVFYLFVVQFGFGITNGWLGSSCMMQANDYVEEGEREAAGGFLVLMLVAGLTTGSLLSFSVAGVS
ncbi:nucleoside transporter-like protein family [Acephala macrosclerotiorum]|nr:nucleoside transporter-like protein family [Acephala macrosclerotiorum]